MDVIIKLFINVAAAGIKDNIRGDAAGAVGSPWGGVGVLSHDKFDITDPGDRIKI